MPRSCGRIRKVAFILLTLCGLARPASAVDCAAGVLRDDPQKKDAGTIEALERSWAQAYAERDIEMLKCIIADDFEIGSMPDKTIEVNGRQHVLEWVPVRTGTADLEQLHVTVHGEVAFARGSYAVRASDGVLRSRFQFADVFVYRAKRWQALSREIATLPLDNSDFSSGT